MRTRSLLVLLLALVSWFLSGCGLMTAQEARTANSVLNGVACGIAAAQETPCTPQAVLDALARDAAAQKAKVEAVAPQAAAVDPAMAQAIVEQLAANTASNAALTKALLDLATRAAAPAPSPFLPMAPAVLPPPAPARAPVLPVPERDADPDGLLNL